MKILMTGDPQEGYTCKFREVLETFADVTVSNSEFFHQTNEFDFVFINWPEELLFWQLPTKEGIKKVSTALDFWKSKSKIVVTMHNEQPHFKQFGREMTDLVYSSADIMLHLGRKSIETHRRNYQAKDIPHVVIPHVLFDYESHLSKAEAREKLGLSPNDSVVLVFGNMRHHDEVKFVNSVFRKLRLPNKNLVYSRYKYRGPRLVKGLQRSIHRFQKHIIRHETRCPDEMVQNYFLSADVVLIPRLDTLNSGIISVAAQFKRIVVGADTGNIGEVLREIKCPVFLPYDVDGAVFAVNEAFKLSQTALPEEIYNHAQKFWSNSSISEILKLELSKALPSSPK